MRHFSKIALTAMAALALSSCQKDEIIQTPETHDSNVIAFSTFSHPGIRGAFKSGTTFTKGDKFQLYGTKKKSGEQASKFHDTFMNGTVGIETAFDGKDWSYGTHKYPWEEEISYDFYGIYPMPSSSHNNLSPQISNGTKIIRVTVPEEESKQTDFMYSAVLGATREKRNGKSPSGDKVPLVFRHAMSIVLFKVKVSNPGLIAKIDGITIHNLRSSGEYTLPVSSDAKGAWNLPKADKYENYPVTMDDTAKSKDLTGKSGEGILLSKATSPLLLLPQSVDKWDPSVQKSIGEADKSHKAYINLRLCLKSSEGNYLIKGTNATNEFSNVYVPFEWDLKEGYKHTILIDFGNGGGGKDHDGKDVIDYIQVSAGLTEWAEESIYTRSL